jgi:hypothetical protein
MRRKTALNKREALFTRSCVAGIVVVELAMKILVTLGKDLTAFAWERANAPARQIETIS